MQLFLKCFLLAILVNTRLMAFAAQENLLKLNDSQLSQMQIQWGKPVSQSQVVSATYPAEVMLPPSQTRIVTSLQPGLIDQLNYSIGDTVQQGQVLGHISSPDILILQTNYLQAEIQAKLNESNLKRNKELFDNGVIAQRLYQESQSIYESGQALLNERKQALMLAGMNGQQIQQLSQHRKLQNGVAILAPISGQILSQQQQVGSRVDVMTPIFTISNAKPLWLLIQLPTELALKLKAGTLVSLPKLGLQAKVDTVLRQVNKNNQTTPVRASITEGSETLSVGQIVDVALLQTTQAGSQPLFSVPRNAVARQGTKAVIFVRKKEGISVIPVNVIQEKDQQLTLQGPITGNETIATQGIAALKGYWIGLGSH